MRGGGGGGGGGGHRTDFIQAWRIEKCEMAIHFFLLGGGGREGGVKGSQNLGKSSAYFK